MEVKELPGAEQEITLLPYLLSLSVLSHLLELTVLFHLGHLHAISFS